MPMSIRKLATLLELLEEWEGERAEEVDEFWTIDQVREQARSEIMEAIS